MTVAPDNLVAHVFRSPMGWIGVIWARERVQRVIFGHRLKGEACAALALPRSAIPLELTSSQQSLHDRLLAFTEGAPDTFADVGVVLEGRTEFQRAVLAACRQIPYGATSSYAELARAAGRPKAARAVGTTMAKNPIPLIIPCHRVVSSTPTGLGGFSAPGGVDTKRRLLDLEAQLHTV